MFGVFRYIVNWTRSRTTKADKSVSGKRRSFVDRANGLATLAKAARFRFRNSYASLARGTLQKLVCAKELTKYKQRRRIGRFSLTDF